MNQKTVPVKERQYKAGDIVAEVAYSRVISGDGDQWSVNPEVRVQSIDTKVVYWIRGAELITTLLSADHFEEEVELPLTEVVKRFVAAGHAPFTVQYIKSKGEGRELRGRMVEHEDLLGRSLVYDFDVKNGSPLRLVDHRTIQWLVIGGKKYTVKNK